MCRHLHLHASVNMVVSILFDQMQKVMEKCAPKIVCVSPVFTGMLAAVLSDRGG